MTPEQKILDILHRHSIDFFCLLPCDRTKKLYDAVLKNFQSVQLSREEEGVGICAGAVMAGARPAMLIQNSGLGNMINALASLGRHYEFPLPILMSWRGGVSETIPAQKWMGEYAPKILEAMDIPCHRICDAKGLDELDDTLPGLFERNEIRAYLFEPSIWQGSDFDPGPLPAPPPRETLPPFDEPMPDAQVSRFEMLKQVAGALEGKAVVCNIGIPCKELALLLAQPSNFYMLGSMGMATPIALGMALRSEKPVVSIDGDGSVLMNPSTLATIARTRPERLVILLADNGAYGSTGDQATAAADCVDLAKVARGFGITNIVRSGDPAQIAEAIKNHDAKGPLLIHAVIRPGNASAPNITISPMEIRRNVTRFLQS